MSLGRAGYAVLQATGALAAWRALAPGPVVLAYHNVIPAGDRSRGESSLHLPLDRFAAQMAWVAERYRFVSLRDLAAVMAAGPVRERLAAVTFDDAYRGVLQHAVPLLESLGAPATIFVVESASDHPSLFWWDAVAEARPHLDRTALRNAHGGDGSAILEATQVDPTSVSLPEDYLPADWDRLRRARNRLVELGAHTSTHPMLTTLSPEALEHELGGTRVRLGRSLQEVPEGLAYPYGDWDQRVAWAASRAGYRFAVTTARSWGNAGRHPLWIPRQTVSAGMSASAFAAAASGLRWFR